MNLRERREEEHNVGVALSASVKGYQYSVTLQLACLARLTASWQAFVPYAWQKL